MTNVMNGAIQVKVNETGKKNGVRAVLIPAYKPDEKMIRLAETLSLAGFAVVIVNDGSGADYYDTFAAASKNAVILYHYTNKGKGEALKTGMRYIAKHFDEPYTVVTADADGQHTPADIIKVCECAEMFPDCLILGSRQFDGDVPLRSRFGNAVTRAVFRMTSGKAVYDTQTGLRAFGSSLVDTMIGIDGSRYEYEMNVLMQAARGGIVIREEPIETVYIEDNSSSHFNTIKDSCRIYKEILKFSASSFISFLTDLGLFCGISALTGGVVLPNILARVISSALNFTLNRRMVFGSKDKDPAPLGTSAAKYFSLAAIILLCNTLLLKGLTALGMPSAAAKIVTEMVLFAFSYFAQHTFVFAKTDKTESRRKESRLTAA